MAHQYSYNASSNGRPGLVCSRQVGVPL